MENGGKRTGADRTNKKTSRRLSRLEDPETEQKTWEAGRRGETQTDQSPKGGGDTTRQKPLKHRDFKSQTEGRINFPLERRIDRRNFLPGRRKRRGESDEEDTTPKDPKPVDKETGKENFPEER